MGRPKGSSPLLKPELQAEICRLLEIGIDAKAASQACGIDESTFHDWSAKGAAGTEPYASFRRAVTRARARGIVNLHMKALAGGKGSHQSMFMLERRFPDQYGSRQRIEHSGPDGKAIEISAKPVQQLSDEELKRLAYGKPD